MTDAADEALAAALAVGGRVERSRTHELATRAFDVVVALTALLVVVPVVLAVTLAVRWSGPGPVLFGHERVGRDGRRFTCWKFRTMVADAESRLDELLTDPATAAEFEENHKLRVDPRVTRVGAVLRRSSLDELPQLVNVLRGEMSVVGPRPVVVDELARYGGAVGAYLSVRPGVTGPWQVQGRSDTSFEERVALDHAYVLHHTLWTDVRYALLTLWVVVRRVGAY